MAELHEILGVSPDATEAAIRKAYRARARKLHPDAGGDAEEFKRVTGAYLVLRDPARRAHYERTGETESAGGDKVREMALSILGQAIAAALEHPEAAAHDFAKTIRDNLKNRNTALALQIKELRAKKTKIERNAKRWRRKAKAEGPDIIAGITLAQIVACEQLVAKVEHEIEVHAAAVEILDGYEYEFEKPKPVTGAHAWQQMGGGAFFKSSNFY